MSIATIDVTGKPCPIPAIEAKKALAGPGAGGALVIVDNIVAVQNLEKMAIGCGYGFSYCGNASGGYDVTIGVAGEVAGEGAEEVAGEVAESVTGNVTGNVTGKADLNAANPTGGLVVAIGRDEMGGGAEDLGKILIKGFLYALSELPVAPESVIFFNSGARLTSAGSNAVDDIKKLEAKGAAILTCGTCVDYYGLPAPAVGDIADMYAIAERMANAAKVLNI